MEQRGGVNVIQLTHHLLLFQLFGKKKVLNRGKKFHIFNNFGTQGAIPDATPTPGLKNKTKQKNNFHA